jgi:hypothetical protein
MTFDTESPTVETPIVRLDDDTQELPVVPVEEPVSPPWPPAPVKPSRHARRRLHGRDVLLLAGGILVIGGLVAIQQVVTSKDPGPVSRPQVQELMVITSPPPSLTSLLPKHLPRPRKTAPRTIAPTEAPRTVKATPKPSPTALTIKPSPKPSHSVRPSPTPPPVVETTLPSPSPDPVSTSPSPSISLPDLPLPTGTKKESSPPGA